MESAEVYKGTFTDELYRRLLERYYAQHDPEVQILAAETDEQRRLADVNLRRALSAGFVCV